MLYAAPAALAGRDALHAHGIRGFNALEPDPVQPRRASAPPPRVQAVLRVYRPHEPSTPRSSTTSLPPRPRLDPAPLQVAARSSNEDAAVAGRYFRPTHRTTPDRLFDACATRPDSHCALLQPILDDVFFGRLQRSSAASRSGSSAPMASPLGRDNAG